MGVIGPKMLGLSGEIADGTVGSVLAGEAYIRWARERIAEGQATSGRTGHHRLSAFVMYAVDRDAQAAKEALRGMMAFYLAANAQERDDRRLRRRRRARRDGSGRTGAGAARDAEPVAQDLVVAGDPDECASKLRRLLDAGAESVVLFPMPVERAAEVVELTAREVLSRLG